MATVLQQMLSLRREFGLGLRLCEVTLVILSLQHEVSLTQFREFALGILGMGLLRFEFLHAGFEGA